MITLIAALNSNYVIWKDNDLLYYIPEDLKRFKKLTLNKSVVMWKKTWDSLPDKYKPLPKRKNIILSRDKDLTIDWATIYNSISELLNNEKDDLFIIWGSQIYKQFINIANKLELTFIEDNKDWNVFFPEIPENFVIDKISDNYKYKSLKYKYITYKKSKLLI